MKKEENVLLELLKVGLWDNVKIADSLPHISNDVNWGEVYQLAEEQSITGLVTAGIEPVQDEWTKVYGTPFIPQEWALQFIGATLQIEQRNKEMNSFVSSLIMRLRKDDVYALLAKGQGLAQCYIKPLWRSCGDVDLFLSGNNYVKAKTLLCPIATEVEEEDTQELHQGLVLNNWIVELHGTLRSCNLPRMDRVIDEAQRDVFYGGDVRSWMNSNTQVFLPGVNSDVIFIFTHLLKHFFNGGIGLRQVCDWCRFLYTYREKINVSLLESRLKKACIITEWKAFASLAVNMLGMPGDSIPLYSSDNVWFKKAHKILRIILKTGNFGHNIDRSYTIKYKGVNRKVATAWHGLIDNISQVSIFPIDSTIVRLNMLKKGVLTIVSGKR